MVNFPFPGRCNRKLYKPSFHHTSGLIVAPSQRNLCCKPCEFSGHPFGAILSQADVMSEGATIIHNGVGHKHLVSEAQGIQTGQAVDQDMISSMQQCIAARNGADQGVASLIEDNAKRSGICSFDNIRNKYQRRWARIMVRLCSEMNIEEPCEFSGPLGNEAILSEAPLGERATIIQEIGVDCKRLAVEAQGTSTEKSEGDDMIWTMQRCIDAGKAAGSMVAHWIEHFFGIDVPRKSTLRFGLRRIWIGLRNQRRKRRWGCCCNSISHVNSASNQRLGKHQSLWNSAMGLPTNSDRYFSSDLGWSRWWSIWCSWKRRRIGSYAKWKWKRVKLIGTFTEKSVSKTPLIAGKSRTDNPQPSPQGKVQRLWQCASSSKRSETGGISASKVGDCEIVCPVLENAAVSIETGVGVASYLEHVSYVSEISGSTSRELHVLSPTRLRGKRSSTFCRNRCTNHNAWVNNHVTPLQSAMIVEKFREFRGTLFETILSEALSQDKERATTIPGMGVHSKLLAVEARNTLQGDDIVSSIWQQVAAPIGAVLNVAIENEEVDYKSVIEIA